MNKRLKMVLRTVLLAAGVVSLVWTMCGCCCCGGGGGRQVQHQPPPVQPGPDGRPRGSGAGPDAYFGGTYSSANVYVGQTQAGVLKIAVMPLKAATELIGSSVSDIVVTELLRTQRYQLVERGQMSKVLSETELAMAGLSEAKAVETAKMLGAEAVVIGTVDEYGQQAKAGDTYAVVALAIRLIDCSNGKIIWSADHARMASGKNTPLPQHARAVVHELVAGLFQQLKRQEGSLPPPPPTGVSVSDLGMREATVTWDQPSSPAPFRYRIERASSERGPFSVAGEVSPSVGRFTDKTDLQDGATYYYRVLAIGGNGKVSDPSSVAETMTAPPPDPPRSVAARSPSSRCIRLTWGIPRAEGIREYRIERASGEDGAWKRLGTTTVTEFTDGGKPGCDITDSTTYRYRVVAVNRVGAESEPSHEASVVSAPPPAAPAGFRAVPDAVRCVPLSWAKSEEKDTAGYELERADSPSAAFVRIARLTSPGATEYLDGGRDPGNLADGHEYRYRIRSFNTLGALGDWTDPLPVTTRFPPPPPAGVSAAQGQPRSSLISWEKSPDEKVVAYEIERTEEGSDAWKAAGSTSGRGSTAFSDRAGAAEKAPTGKLRDGTAYLWRVRAVNTAGAKSEWSEPARAVTKPTPAAPAGVETTRAAVGCVKLRWKPNPEPDIVAYVVEARDADGRSWKTIVKGTPDCSAAENGLDPGEQRVYRVKAVDVHTHESPWSAEVPGMARPLPEPPRALSARTVADGVELTFKPPRAGMTAYKIYRKKFFGQELLATVEEPRAIIPALPPGDTIDVFATAIDERGLESKPSEKITIGK